MNRYNFFVSLVFVTRNSSGVLKEQLYQIEQLLKNSTEDYEIIVIDNASEDDTLSLLQVLTQKDGFPNLQVYALTKEVNSDTATWVGFENALGDVVISFDPINDDLNIIPKMLQLSADGKDIVFAKNNTQRPGLSYNTAYSIYNLFFRTISGVNLSTEAPSFRLLSKKVVNYLLKFPNPVQQYRFLAATAGFPKDTITYNSNTPAFQTKKSLRQSLEQGMSLLVSTTKAPMRIVNFCSLFGAAANLIYSIYVLYIAFTKVDVAPGWTTLSLQQSGMFFLISVVLFVLGEYILYMASLSSEGPKYHIAQEMTSSTILHRERLNVTH